MCLDVQSVSNSEKWSYIVFRTKHVTTIPGGDSHPGAPQDLCLYADFVRTSIKEALAKALPNTPLLLERQVGSVMGNQWSFRRFFVFCLVRNPGPNRCICTEESFHIHGMLLLMFVNSIHFFVVQVASQCFISFIEYWFAYPQNPQHKIDIIMPLPSMNSMVQRVFDFVMSSALWAIQSGLRVWYKLMLHLVTVDWAYFRLALFP